VVGADDLKEYVGKRTFQSECFYDKNPPGVVTGLAWTSMGGAVLYIEAQPAGPPHEDLASGGEEGGKRSRGGGGLSGGGIRTTGMLGDVMKESISIGYTFARGYLKQLDSTNEYLEKQPLHVHVPEGATPKDGPSAGVTMVTSLLSLATGVAPRESLAMTGELSLTGKVLPIGGVKEKTIAAQRAGIKHIVFPKANEQDFAELPDVLKEGVEAHFASHYDDVYRLAFGAQPPTDPS